MVDKDLQPLSTMPARCKKVANENRAREAPLPGFRLQKTLYSGYFSLEGNYDVVWGSRLLRIQEFIQDDTKTGLMFLLTSR